MYRAEWLSIQAVGKAITLHVEGSKCSRYRLAGDAFNSVQILNCIQLILDFCLCRSGGSRE